LGSQALILHQKRNQTDIEALLHLEQMIIFRSRPRPFLQIKEQR
jgi:hypothetical protein